MGFYAESKRSYSDTTVIPSTNIANFINKGDMFGWTLGWGFVGCIPALAGLALTIEISLWFIFIPVAWALLGILILVGKLSSFNLEGYDYTRSVLPVEQAYARLSPQRKKQYKRLVREAYWNEKNHKSNKQILELLETYAEIDQKAAEKPGLSKFVTDELEIARKVKKDLKEMERILEGT